MPVRWPSGLWFRDLTQNGDLHLAAYDTTIALRVHVDAFHGDRQRNNALIDRLREQIEEDLLLRLPSHDRLDWRAAEGGNNQVSAVTRAGGTATGRPSDDATWLVQAATAWLTTLREHPMPDLRRQVSP